MSAAGDKTKRIDKIDLSDYTPTGKTDTVEGNREIKQIVSYDDNNNRDTVSDGYTE